jgi:heme A synthase
MLTLTIFWLSGGGRLDWSARPAVSRAIVIGGVALLLIAATGAVTALADTLFPTEGTDPEGTSHFLTRLRIVHPVLAAVSAATGWWASTRNGLPQHRAAWWLPLLVVAMLLTGALNVLLHTPLVMQVLHLALADALWIAFVLVSAASLASARVTAGR